jgi:hypothetical protein
MLHQKKTQKTSGLLTPGSRLLENTIPSVMATLSWPVDTPASSTLARDRSTTLVGLVIVVGTVS